MLLTARNKPGALAWSGVLAQAGRRRNGAAVRCANPLDDPAWDSQLEVHPNRSFFHRSTWARVLAETYRCTPAYFMTGDNGRLETLLPIMEINSVMTGKRGVMLPFSDYCAPVCARRSDFQDLFQQALAEGAERGWRSLELRGGREWLADAPASAAYFGHSVDLRRSEDAIFNSFHPAMRRAIRKAQGAGLEIKISQTLEAVRLFYGLQCKTRRRHGLPPQSFGFFRSIQRRILSRDEGRVFLALHDGIPVAGAVFFHADGQVLYKYAASDETHQEWRGNNFVLWEGIKYYARRGEQSLHLGRTNADHDGLRRFKLGFGAAEERIEYFKYDLGQDRFVAGRDQTTGWHNRVFRTLPVFASRLIGSALYRHWA